MAILPTKHRLGWLLLSLSAMFVSAYSAFRWMSAVASISGWTGLPQYEAQIPGLRSRAEIWLCLAGVLPFVAAWFLGLGEKQQVDQIGSPTLLLTYSCDSRPWSSVFEYGVRLGVSIVGALAFALCLFLLGRLLYGR